MPLNLPSPSQIDQSEEVHKLLGDHIKQVDEMESLEPEPWESAEELGGCESPICPASVQVAEPHWEEVHCGLFL